MPSTVAGGRDPGDVEDRRAHVDRVCELRPEAAPVGDALGPADHHRVARATEVRAHLLAPLERGVARPRPRRPVVRIHDRLTPPIDAAVALGELQLHLVGERDAVLHGELVERAGEGPFHAGAVVAPDPDDQGVVELAELLDRVDDAADVVVRVLGEPGIDLHLTGVEGPQRVRNVVPCWEGVVTGRELGVLRDHAEFLLAGERLLPQPVPALIELPLVLVCPRIRDVMRRMAAPGRVVDEERLRGVLRADAVEPLDRPVRHRVGEVVGVVLVVELLRRADDLLVLGQAGVPLARSATEDPVEVVEAPAVRPPVERSGRALLAVGGQVPFPERGRGVAVVSKDPRERRAVPRQRGGVPREAPRELADRAEPDRVVVPSGEQRGAGG